MEEDIEYGSLNAKEEKLVWLCFWTESVGKTTNPGY